MVEQLRGRALGHDLHSNIGKLAYQGSLPNQGGGNGEPSMENSTLTMTAATILCLADCLLLGIHEARDWKVGHCCRKILQFQISCKSIKLVESNPQSESQLHGKTENMIFRYFYPLWYRKTQHKEVFVDANSQFTYVRYNPNPSKSGLQGLL